jgi:hypothetical protein
MTTVEIENFKKWQVQHYSQRLSEARTTEEKSFLRSQLYNLKKPANGNRDTLIHHRPCSVLDMQTIGE